MAEEYVFTMDEQAKLYAEEVLNETDESREKCIQEIKDWLTENPQLNARSEDKHILIFLRGCKFNVEKTKNKMKNFYLMRRDNSAWFISRNPEEKSMKRLVKLGVFVPLKLLHENRLVVIIRPAGHNPSVDSLDDVMKAGLMILDIATMENEIAQIYGITGFFDMSNLSYGHAKQLNPTIIKKMVNSWQNYSCRPKQLEFFNAPLYINVMLNIFKSFMSQKLKGRVRVHFKGTQSIHNVINKAILPKEYGGETETMDELANYWYEKLVSYEDWFKDDEKYRAE